MTLQQLGALVARRWYVALTILMITAFLAVWLPPHPGVFWGRATVVFTPPVNPARIGNVLEGSDPSLIYFAAAVEKTIEAGQSEVGLSSSTAALYGTGVREGHSLTLVNTGGQWQSNYNRPMLVVEVVGTTADRAQADLDAVIASVQSTAHRMQVEAGAQSAKLIATEVSPQAPQVEFVPGNRTRGLAAVIALGLALSVVGSVAVDRVSGRRRSASAPSTGLVASA